VRARFSGKTDVGRQRDQNEDALLLLSDLGVVAVCDGLGGHRSGHLASQLCVSTLTDFFLITVASDGTWPFPYDEGLSDEENYLFTGIRLANRRIFDRSLKNLSDFGMGTTCVTAMFDKTASHVSIAHVGDSRSYRVRDGDIIQLTRDHSLLSDALTLAPWMTEEEIGQLPPNVVTRALGIREEVEIDIHREATRLGDVYVLCSDGLSSLVTDEEVRDIILEDLERREPLAATCDRLVAAANDYGGTDNVTVVLAYLEE
jgi:serine/threonine protein phosphatase PrpC